MSEGRKDDQDKHRMELLPPRALEAVSDVFTFGAKKYDDRNWELGIDYSRVYGALLRHLTAWWRGEDTDPESHMSHLAHAGCCLLMLLEFDALDYTDLDDRPTRREVHEPEDNVDTDSSVRSSNVMDSVGGHGTRAGRSEGSILDDIEQHTEGCFKCHGNNIKLGVCLDCNEKL